MTELYMMPLSQDLEITPELARKVARYTAEELARATPNELKVLLGCHELLAKKIFIYAKMKAGGARREEPAPRVVVVGTVSYNQLNLLIGLVVAAFKLKKIPEKTAQRPVLVEFPEAPGVKLWVRIKGLHFAISDAPAECEYEIYNPANLLDAISMMGDDRMRGIALDVLLNRLIAFAEGYKE